MAKKIGLQIPTLKITRQKVSDQEEMFQALVDYSNDIQGFLQQVVSAINQNFRLNPSSTATNGYLTLPNGIILQWMTGSGNNPGVSNALPSVFPNAGLAAFACGDGSATALSSAITDAGHVTVTTPAAGVVNCFILAIGH